MNLQERNNIYWTISQNLNTVNDLLENWAIAIDDNLLFKYLNNKVYDLNTQDPNIYLASLCYYIYNNKQEEIKVNNTETPKLILINFFNIILEELNQLPINYEVRS